MTDIVGNLPFTLTNGQEADADQVMANFDKIVDDVNANAMPRTQTYRGCCVTRDAGLELTHGTANKIPFNTVYFDSDSIFNISTPTRLTVPSGVTKIRLRAQFTTNDPALNGEQIDLSFFKGALSITSPCGFICSLQENQYTGQLYSSVINVIAGNYFQFDVYPSTADDITLIEGDCFFEMEILQ